MDERTRKEFSKWGKTPPTSDPHGTPEDIKKNMTRLLPDTWKLEGNKLTGETVMGTLVQYIPPDYILVGTEKGLPKLVKVKPQ